MPTKQATTKAAKKKPEKKTHTGDRRVACQGEDHREVSWFR
jgi:hypothetical protein